MKEAFGSSTATIPTPMACTNGEVGYLQVQGFTGTTGEVPTTH